MAKVANPQVAYPVPFQETWNVVDPSKVENWLDCKRRFFFEHVLGWRSDAPNVHLVFGEGMHRALEHMYIEGIAGGRGYTMDVIQEAYEKFLSYYREHFDEEQDEIYHPKSPNKLFQGLVQYAGENEARDRHLEVLYTEVAGSVPISNENDMFFRIDVILYDPERDEYFTHEHKSGSGINRFWTDKWALHHQPFTYTHVLYSTFNPNKVKGVKINGIHFMKSKVELIRIPCWKTPHQMQTWLWEIRDIFSDIEFEFSRFAECSVNDPTLMAFPKNPNSCTKYFGCPYHDFCCAWSNPLREADRPPAGFAIDYWDPRDLYHTSHWELRDAHFIGENTANHF